MANENDPETITQEMIQSLRSRGLTCGRLKKMEENKAKDAKMFRSVGFNNLAGNEEESAKKIRELRRKVCLLK